MVKKTLKKLDEKVEDLQELKLRMVKPIGTRKEEGEDCPFEIKHKKVFS